MTDNQTPASAFPPGEYVTRDGRKARVYANDGGGRYPVHGAIWEGDRWTLTLGTWAADGRAFSGVPDGADLLPPRPATRKVRVRVAAMYADDGEVEAWGLADRECIGNVPDDWLRDMPDGKPAEVEIEIIDRRPK